jgi:hypothetical protein
VQRLLYMSPHEQKGSRPWAVRLIQGWPPVGHRVVGLGKALAPPSKSNPIFPHFDSLSCRQIGQILRLLLIRSNQKNPLEAQTYGEGCPQG